MSLRSRRRIGSLPSLALLLFLLVSGTVAWACSVPVYRYGLERWPADPYRAVVFHRGELTPDQQAWVKALQPLSEDGRNIANLAVMTVDLDGEVDPELQKFWEEQESGGVLPWIVTQFPLAAWHPGVVESTALTAETPKQLLDSPARAAVAKQLLSGKSSSWIFLECGNAEQDEAAFKVLTAELARMPEVLKLPEQEEDPSGDPFALPSTDNLKIDFATVRVRRDDPAERALVAMLLNSEEDLHELSGPMAFPVFARGRALYALVDKGINANTIEAACSFLIGPCSCEVKAQNPGTDLLMNVDWEGLVTPTARTDKELPPLAGLAGFVAADDPASADSTTDVESAGTPPAAQPNENESDESGTDSKALAAATAQGEPSGTADKELQPIETADSSVGQSPSSQLKPPVLYTLWGLMAAVLLLAFGSLHLVFGSR